jgi:hypothetical protein
MSLTAMWNLMSLSRVDMSPSHRVPASREPVPRSTDMTDSHEET